MQTKLFKITYIDKSDDILRSILIWSSSVLDAINECDLTDLDAIVKVEFEPRIEDGKLVW